MKKYSSQIDSPNHLTEFAPLSSEVNQPATSFSWQKLFKWNKGNSSDASSSASTLNDAKQSSKEEVEDASDSSSNECSTDKSKAASEDSASLQLPKESEIYTRSFTNVLKRISSILDKRLSTPNSYKDSDFKQYWMPDSDCKECYDCGDKFTTFRRRHHCRVCGQIFCSRCCNQEIPGKIIGCPGDLRVCTYCCKVVLACLQSSEVSAGSSDLRSLQEDLQNKLSVLVEHSDSTPTDANSRFYPRRKNSIGFREQGYARTRTISSADSSIFPGGRDFLSPEQNTDEWKLLIQDSTQLKELWLEIQDPINGIQFHNHRQRLTTHPNCVVGSELVEWLISADKACSRHQAVAICQALLDSKYLEPINVHEKIFLDEYALYKAGMVGLMETNRAQACKDYQQEHQEVQEPTWVKEIKQDACDAQYDTVVIEGDEWEQQDKDEFEDLSQGTLSRISSSRSMFYVSLDPEENTATLNKNVVASSSHLRNDFGNEPSTVAFVSRNAQTEGSRTLINEEFLEGAIEANITNQALREGWYSSQTLQHDNGESLAFEKLSTAFEQHEMALLFQLLNCHGLPQSWADIIRPIAHKVAKTVKPDEKFDGEIDIRQYVQFKKIPGGKMSDCEIINGVVCTKNVAHKKMICRIANPTILLISSPIVYQRQENKLLSLEPAILQEYNCLKNAVAKIATFKPDIVLVEKTVSRLAQDFLLDLDITLAPNVKQSVLERIARLTEADIVKSIDAQISNPPKLGTCKHFHVLNYALPKGCSKTLMIFDGCAPHLGCTIVLRGADNVQLSKVKLITQFMIYVKYNQQLERSFLMDEFAMLPPMAEEKIFGIGDGECTSSELDDSLSSGFTDSPKGLVHKGHYVAEHDKKNDFSTDDAALQKKNHGRLSYQDANDAVLYSASERKCESKCVDDLSDPLRLYQQSEDDSIFECEGSQMQVAAMPLANRFREALDGTILSISPSVQYALPYLESEPGRSSKLRKFLPEQIFYSEQFTRDKQAAVKRTLPQQCRNNEGEGSLYPGAHSFDLVEVLSPHPFLDMKISTPIDHMDVQTQLADFRAQGGRFRQLTSSERLDRTFKLSKEARKKDENHNLVNYNFWSDALDPLNHQRLSVLFCSYSLQSINAPSCCVNPWIPHMAFYGCNDISLGGFLERYCFSPTYVCPNGNCDRPMTEHVRRFVHENGCIHILHHELEYPIKRQFPNAISMWSWCRKCKGVTNVAPLSSDTCALSFAKYLEIRFHNNMYTRRGLNECSHSLHHDHYQYFAFQQMVTAFKFSQIILREVALPPIVIDCIQIPSYSSSIIEDIKQLAVKGHSVFTAVLERICRMDEESEYADTKYKEMVQGLLSQLQTEKNVFRERIEEIQIRLTSPTVENAKGDISARGKDGKKSSKDSQASLWKISDCVVNLKRLVAETVANWNLRLVELVQQRRKDEKLSKPATGNLKAIPIQVGVDIAPIIEVVPSSHGVTVQKLDDALTPEKENVPSPSLESVENCGATTSGKDVSCLPVNGAQINRSLQASIHKISSEPLTLSSLSYNSGKDSKIPEPVNTSISHPVSADSKTKFTVGASFGESSDNASNISGGADPVLSVETHLTKKAEMRGHERSRSDGDGKEFFDKKMKLSSVAKQDDEHIDVSKVEKKPTATSVKSMFSQLLSTSASIVLPPAFPSTEHHLLPHCERIPLVVYENEPSSIIAYALSSADYELSMQELKLTTVGQLKEPKPSSPVMKRKMTSRDSTSSYSNIDGMGSTADNIQGATRKMGGGNVLSLFRNMERGGLSWPSRPSSPSAFEAVHYTVSIAEKDNMVDELESDDRESTSLAGQEAEKDKTLSNGKLINHNVEVQFTDSSAKFYCRVFFAEQFAQIRKFLLPDGEDGFVRSLSRCNDWLAKGGKSGCTFCKTHDDRFILKQMTRFEVESFRIFAPHYVQYIKKAFAEQKPTALAKIVGAYRIVYRNIQSNVTSKMDLLVMENLFYGHNISQTFDLKGSIRNRLVSTTGKPGDDTVLLDENLLKMTCDHPLYVRPHSKSVLTHGINNDTHFLSQHLVMDYSLLVGIDDVDKELVVGIIDYIRTFTWDKKLETIIKSSVILGGQGKLPTVVSPEIYRSRFCEAMDGYFLQVPDHWSNLGRGIDF